MRMDAISAALRVCVDSVEDGRVQGRVYSRRLAQPMEFQDMSQLILQVDDVLDHQNYPQAFQQIRTFQKVKKERPNLAVDQLEDGLTAEEVAAAHGKLETITLSIFSRRSATWQGRIEWAGGSEMFTSVLELLKLLEQMLFPHAEKSI